MIYLCRHGETEFNRQHRLQGRLESALTPLGVRQAGAMADLLHDLVARDPSGAWRVVSSPLGRARATAAIIAARLALSVEIDERLIEIAMGAWEGRSREDLAREFPAQLAHPGWYFDAPGGETFAQVMARVSDWLAAQPDGPDRRVIAVSHGVAGRLLRGAYAGLPREIMLRQAVPQDALYRLSHGQVDRLDCEPVD